MKILNLQDHKTMPWANGGGITTELWRLDDDKGMVARLSMANVDQSGPFSCFNGVDRVIGHLDGGPMVLASSEGQTVLTQGMTYRFAGETAIEAMISAPCRDFNLMLRRGTATGDFTIRSFSLNSAPLSLQAGPNRVFIFALGGVLKLNDHVLQPYDLALLEHETGLLRGTGRCVEGWVG